MDRRTVLQTDAGLVSTTALAGCLGRVFETRAFSEPSVVENRPNAVYYPSHIEGMEMAGMAKKESLKFALTYSFPHRFWTITGRNLNKVSIQQDDSVHLMGTVWDNETGIVLPAATLSVAVTKGGTTVDERPLWPMLSQNMGYHFGDNMSLEGSGMYTAKVRIGGMQSRGTGKLEGRFGQPVTLETEFTYSERTRNGIMFERLDEKKGTKGAVEPMDMDMMPVASTPSVDELPGRAIGEATSGDGVFVATVLEDASRFTDDGRPYLAVSARTPYNQFPLAFMSVSATLTRDASTVFDEALQPTIDHELKYHYGAAIESVESGDTLTITVGAPPQVARHEGYETAFLDMPEMQLSVPG